MTEILGDHLSSARVLDENLSNPIARDDKVYTPLWHKGDVLHFAILGNIDLDKDGTDDRQLVRDLITSRGGVIDAEMDATGKITGSMDINTRYLIEGKITTDRPAVDGKTVMVNQAEQLGIERIPAPRFFEESGWKYDAAQVVRYGKDGTRSRIPFDKRTKSISQATSTAETNFSRRRPWNPKKVDTTDDGTQEEEVKKGKEKKDKN